MSLKPYKLILQKDNNTSQIITDNLNNLTIIEDNIKLQGDVSICDASSNILYKLPTLSPSSVNSYLLSSDINNNLTFTQSNIFINNIITYYVSPSGNNTYSGSNVNNPFQTITYALSVINNISSNINNTLNKPQKKNNLYKLKLNDIKKIAEEKNIMLTKKNGKTTKLKTKEELIEEIICN